MKLDGLHHITMITDDARRNVEFYADVLGFRLLKETVNFDAPEAYPCTSATSRARRARS
jgi:glyoxalase family protein